MYTLRGRDLSEFKDGLEAAVAAQSKMPPPVQDLSEAAGAKLKDLASSSMIED